MSLRSNGEDIKDTVQQRRAKWPKPLQSPRPRTLTSPLPTNESELHETKFCRPFPPSLHESTIAQRTMSQDESCLFWLPSEIRRLIWVEVLHRGVVHLVRADRRLLGIECGEQPAADDDDMQFHPCWGFQRLVSQASSQTHLNAVMIGTINLFQVDGAFEPFCILKLPLVARPWDNSNSTTLPRSASVDNIKTH